jgi:7,8-dihydropterin-6-yl-methyl-4-(beta-D-ribofuranosyl)aminobenzene 5'-phosphate synthase
MKTVAGRVTVLSDNLVPGRSELIGEHGFSAYIETEKGNFLFDAGRGKAVVHNALLLKKDLTALAKIFLSHGHGDHTGGLPDVLRIQRKSRTDVYAHPYVFAYRYRETNGQETYGGIPFTRGYLEKMGARFLLDEAYREVEEGMFLTGEVPRRTSFEGGDMSGRFLRLEGDNIVPDIVQDDQSLVIHTDQGLMIVLGCAHAGIINTLEYITERTGVDQIYGIVGGTHMGFSGDAQLLESIKELKFFHIKHLVPSHCTSMAAAARIKQEFEGTFQFSHVGWHIDF